MASLPKQSTECLILWTLNINAPTFMASRDHDRGGEHAAALTVLLGARLARARCRAVRDSTLVTWYPSLYAPRTGGAYDSHHRTAGIAGCTRRRGSCMVARGRAAIGDADDRIPQLGLAAADPSHEQSASQWREFWAGEATMSGRNLGLSAFL